MRRTILTRSLLAAAIAVVALAHPAVHAQDAATTARIAEGKRVYVRANCVGCHKWHGGGGGGYGGDALSLRATQLDAEQIVDTVSCGRPGTGMPSFRRAAYDDAEHPCYGMSREDVGKIIPPEANVFLRPAEIEAVAAYVVAVVKGRGAPRYDECTAFFGDGARVCNIYKADAGGKAEP